MARVGTCGAYYPFQELQAILEKQKAHPMRTATPRDPPKQNQNEKGLIMHRRRVENQENTTKKMYPEKVLKQGFTWQDMIARTNEEKVIAFKVNVSQSRINHPKSIRTLLPSENPEQEPHLARKLTIPEKQNPCKRGTPNLITGESTSELDHRVRNKANWKIGLINKYQNNQDMWGDRTNDFVNRLKEEVNYEPAKDFKPEVGWVDTRLQRKLDIMSEQCKLHKDNMANNPITGTRLDEQKISKRKNVDLSERTLKSDILNTAPDEVYPARPFTPGRKSFAVKPEERDTAARVLAVSKSPNRPTINKGMDTAPQRDRIDYSHMSQRSLTPSRANFRTQQIEQTPPRKFRNDGPDDNGQSAAQAIRQTTKADKSPTTPKLPKTARDQFSKSMVFTSSISHSGLPRSPQPMRRDPLPAQPDRSPTPNSRNQNRVEYSKQIAA